MGGWWGFRTLREAYHGAVGPGALGARCPVAQLDSYKGLLFATFDPGRRRRSWSISVR